MNSSNSHSGRHVSGWRAWITWLASLVVPGACLGQGTVTIGFEGPAFPGAPAPQPPGTYSVMFEYSESGMLFTVPNHPDSLLLVGSGLAGAPDNGTAYLDTLVNTTVFASFNSGTRFRLVSVDAVGLTLGGTLHVVGHRHDGTTATDDFLPWAGLSFHTLNFDADFADLDRIDISGGWALDNLVLDVPEPSWSAWGFIAALSLLGWSRWRRPPQVARMGKQP